MPTFRCAKISSALPAVARFGGALVLAGTALAVSWTPAPAGSIASTSCSGTTWNSFHCFTRWGWARNPFVRLVPQPLDDAERQRAAERDRKWEARCQPTLAHDRYGVARYRYSAPGCEFGVSED